MPDEFIHQSVRNRNWYEDNNPDTISRKIACGADINEVKHSSVCANVTCPKCLEWQKKVVEAVFTPLPDGQPGSCHCQDTQPGS